MSFFLLLVGLALLLGGGTCLVRGASGIAGAYGISPLIVGLTVVAFGTSAPELVVNVVGALRHETELAFGNVVGSNLANLGLVLGVATLIKPITIQGQIVRRELPLLLLGTIIFLVMTLDQLLLGEMPVLTRSDGLILLLLFSVFVYIMTSDFLAQREDPLLSNVLEISAKMPLRRVTSLKSYWIYIVLGIIALTLGGQLTIVNGSHLAYAMGWSPVIVGMIIVAVGTSLPELVTSIIAALNDESDLCVGNVIGSNLFNSLFVLPISAIILPLPIPGGGIVDILVTLGFSAILLPVFFYGEGKMGRLLGLVFLMAYVGYLMLRVFA